VFLNIARKMSFSPSCEAVPFQNSIYATSSCTSALFSSFQFRGTLVFISEHEVRAALADETLIPAIRQALLDYSAGLVVQPPRSILRAGKS
jgi:hypothetical protein